MKIEAAIKKQFSVNVDTTRNDNGAITFTLNNGHLTPGTDSNPGVLTAKSLSAVLEPFWQKFRQSGWTFTQPMNGSFTIAVTS